MGDFNEILEDSEKSEGNLRRDDRMRDFKYCLEDCGLKDLGFVGHQFTWTNKQAGDNNIQESLNRGLTNDQWMEIFPHARVTHLRRLLSDHCQIHVNWKKPHRREGLKRKVKIFCFEDMWLREESCDMVVNRGWSPEGNPMRLARAIEGCGHALSLWSSKEFGELPKEIEKVKNEIESLATVPQTESVVMLVKALENRLEALLKREEIFWRQ